MLNLQILLLAMGHLPMQEQMAVPLSVRAAALPQTYSASLQVNKQGVLGRERVEQEAHSVPQQVHLPLPQVLPVISLLILSLAQHLVRMTKALPPSTFYNVLRLYLHLQLLYVRVKQPRPFPLSATMASLALGLLLLSLLLLPASILILLLLLLALVPWQQLSLLIFFLLKTPPYPTISVTENL